MKVGSIERRKLWDDVIPGDEYCISSHHLLKR